MRGRGGIGRVWNRRLALVLVRLYPRAWRERYQEELTDLLEADGVDFKGAVDLVRGAWDAHVHLGELLAWDTSSRVRRTSLATVATWTAFILAVCGVVKVLDDPAFSAIAREHVALGWAGWTITAAAVASALAVALGALPPAATVARRAWRARDRRTLGLLSLPAHALVAFLLSGWGLGRLPATGVAPSFGHTLFILWIAFGVALVLVCLVGLRSAVVRYEMPLRLWVWTGRAAMAASAIMIVGALAVAAYAVELAVLAPGLFRGSGGLVATPLPYTLLPIVMVALAAGVTGLRSASSGYGLLREGRS